MQKVQVQNWYKHLSTQAMTRHQNCHKKTSLCLEQHPTKDLQGRGAPDRNRARNLSWGIQLIQPATYTVKKAWYKPPNNFPDHWSMFIAVEQAKRIHACCIRRHAYPRSNTDGTTTGSYYRRHKYSMQNCRNTSMSCAENAEDTLRDSVKNASRLYCCSRPHPAYMACSSQKVPAGQNSSGWQPCDSSPDELC